ncbi:hypothetical protein U6A24_10190 [Aquimarina gracilis]|uniref:DUF3299 domain-containing protein n=1 Tax=Aquimarina gracilis TaxID=874422 RepID=A0ABU5ZV17_9FLAO|nr:hypothetical protein [Aquimarina gracilis]MEB3345833.1 hypothetical protein [Aquimarina gracilis]
MHKIVFLALFLILTKFNLLSQEKLNWDDFADVKFSRVYSAAYDDFFLKPKFGPMIQTYEGAKIRIKGYFLDFSIEEDQFYLLSQNPRASCFFCGGAGPESVVEVIFKQRPNFKMDQIVEVTGILQLNADDVDHCNYILKEATGRLVK